MPNLVQCFEFALSFSLLEDKTIKFLEEKKLKMHVFDTILTYSFLCQISILLGLWPINLNVDVHSVEETKLVSCACIILVTQNVYLSWENPSHETLTNSRDSRAKEGHIRSTSREATLCLKPSHSGCKEQHRMPHLI